MKEFGSIVVVVVIIFIIIIGMIECIGSVLRLMLLVWVFFVVSIEYVVVVPLSYFLTIVLLFHNPHRIVTLE